jgi:hypothetical protein
MVGAWHGHREAAEAQGDRQALPRHAPGYDPQDLRQSSW